MQKFFLSMVVIFTAALSFHWAPVPGLYSQDSWQTVEIRAEEYRFLPNRIRIEAGRPLRLIIINEGNEPHRFRSSLFNNRMIEVKFGENVVRGAGIERIDIVPGAEATIELLSPPAGEFYFECRIPSHHGMDGLILIQ